MKVMKFSQMELLSMKDKMDVIDFHNKKLQHARKRQLADALKESTDIRVDIMKKIKNWIDLLEKRIFNDQTIGDMDLSKVISLFKTVSLYSLEMLKQINDIEGLFKAYTESVTKIEETNKAALPNKTDGELAEMKKNIMAAFIDSMKARASDATVKTEEMATIAANNADELPPLEDAPMGKDDLRRLDMDVPVIGETFQFGQTGEQMEATDGEIVSSEEPLEKAPETPGAEPD